MGFCDELASIDIIYKFNPYHDSSGRFASANGASSFSAKPGRLKNETGARAAMQPKKPQSGGSSTTIPVSTRGHISQKDYFGNVRDEKQGVEIIRKDLEKSSGTKVSSKEAQGMFNSVLSYSGSEYGAIRQAQVSPKKAKASTLHKAQQIEDFIDKSPKWDGGDLYRGMNLSQESIKALQKGKKIDMQGLSSWSSDQKIAKNYNRGDGDAVIFVLPKTKQGTSIEHLSDFPGEKEVLVSSKAQFNIRDVKQKKKFGKTTTYIHLEEAG